MARYYYVPKAREDSKAHGGEIGGEMTAGQNPDRPNMVQRPPLFGGGEVPLKPGGIAFGLVGHDWWHLGPGEYVDLPDGTPVWVVKNMSPHLLTKGEAVKAGVANEDGSLKSHPFEEEKPLKKQPQKQI